jgi:hypothetical protein
VDFDMPINSRFSSTSAASSTRGAPIAIAAHNTGSSIQPAMETTTLAGPKTLRNWPVARCSTLHTATFRPKYGCHR